MKRHLLMKMKNMPVKDKHEKHEDDEDHDDHVQMNEIDHYDKGEHDDMSESYYDSDRHHHMHRSRHAKEPPGPNVHVVSDRDYDLHKGGASKEEYMGGMPKHERVKVGKVLMRKRMKA